MKMVDLVIHKQPGSLSSSPDASPEPFRIARLEGGTLEYAGLPVATLSKLPGESGAGSGEFRGYLVSTTDGGIGRRGYSSLTEYVSEELESRPEDNDPLRYCAYHQLAFPDGTMLIAVAVRIRDGLTISGYEQGVMDRIDRTYPPEDYKGYQFRYLEPSGRVVGGLTKVETKHSVMVECGDHEWARIVVQAMAEKIRDGSGVDAAYNELFRMAKAAGALTTSEV